VCRLDRRDVRVERGCFLRSWMLRVLAHAQSGAMRVPQGGRFALNMPGEHARLLIWHGVVVVCVYVCVCVCMPGCVCWVSIIF